MNLMLQKILTAIGDSSESAKVLETRLTLAEKFGAEISILHVLNPTRSGFELTELPSRPLIYITALT
jgi:nucleotide-binding universal stress UspA family protein